MIRSLAAMNHALHPFQKGHQRKPGDNTHNVKPTLKILRYYSTFASARSQDPDNALARMIPSQGGLNSTNHCPKTALHFLYSINPSAFYLFALLHAIPIQH